MVCSLPFFTGCATIFGGHTQTMTMKSDPPGATYQYGPYSGKTPTTFEAARGDLAHVATFKLAGYEEKTVPVQTGVQGVTWVNVLFWPGLIVDRGRIASRDARPSTGPEKRSA